MASRELSRTEALACPAYKHACHVMLYSTTNTLLFRRIPMRYIILVRNCDPSIVCTCICLNCELCNMRKCLEAPLRHVRLQPSVFHEHRSLLMLLDQKGSKKMRLPIDADAL